MSDEKFEDLFPTIRDDEPFEFTRAELNGVRVALRWLDEHPDRAPGRTMTESEVVEVFEASKSGGGATRTALIRHGIKVVPDPAPTNVEKLVELIREAGYDIRHNGKRSGSVKLAMDLHDLGVTAP